MTHWILVILLFTSAPAIAESVYKWTDADGKVHYGGAPEGQKSEAVPVEKAPPPDKSLEERNKQQDDYLKARERERSARKTDKELRKIFEDMKDNLRGGPARR